jgi:predicted HTH domain antitoxin
MQILVEIPPALLDAMQRTPQEFDVEAKMALAAKLYEMKRLSSGMAATIAGVSRVQFLYELHRFGVSVIDVTEAELEADVANA